MQNSQRLKFRGAETVKIAYFEAPNLQNLISRKIWMAKKFRCFHTVQHLLLSYRQNQKVI